WTVLLTVLLVLVSDFSWFDAKNHALTTLGAGGFSPNPMSVAGYSNPGAEWLLTAFMLLSGTNFVLQYKVLTGRLLGFFRDGEFVLYVGVMVAFSLMIAALLSAGVPTLEAVRTSAF